MEVACLSPLGLPQDTGMTVGGRGVCRWRSLGEIQTVSSGRRGKTLTCSDRRTEKSKSAADGDILLSRFARKMKIGQC